MGDGAQIEELKWFCVLLDWNL